MAAEPLIGEIMIFASNFAPTGWATCDGQLLPIAQNVALFSLLGTKYGGDGTNTFALPDMRGRMPLHYGNGPGLTGRALGEAAGVEEHTLRTNELPSHTHPMMVRNAQADATIATGNVIANAPTHPAFTQNPPNMTMNANAIGATGDGKPHNNMPPYLALNFCIALQGQYPTRN